MSIIEQYVYHESRSDSGHDDQSRGHSLVAHVPARCDETTVPLPERGLSPREAVDVCRWLHDEPLQVLEYMARADTCADHALRTAADKAAHRLRLLVDNDLHVPETATELVSGLCDLVRDAQRQMQAEVRLRLRRMDGMVTGAAANSLVAATREALTNAGKHARATTVEVECDVAHDEARVEVRDNGVGFDPTSTDGRFGLRNSIIGRLEPLGHARVFAGAGRGTTVQLVVHRQAAREEQPA